MIQTQILTEIERPPIPDRLTLLEDALRVIRRDLQGQNRRRVRPTGASSSLTRPKSYLRITPPTLS